MPRFYRQVARLLPRSPPDRNFLDIKHLHSTVGLVGDVNPSPGRSREFQGVGIHVLPVPTWERSLPVES